VLIVLIIIKLMTLHWHMLNLFLTSNSVYFSSTHYQCYPIFT